MSEVTIFNNLSKETKIIDRVVLSSYRRNGWVLVEDKPVGKNHLKDRGQSNQEATSSSELDPKEEA